MRQEDNQLDDELESEVSIERDDNRSNTDDKTLGDLYDYQTGEELLMDDEVDSAEAGFMHGHEEAVFAEREKKKKRTAT